MIERRQGVADVVEERTHHVLLVTPVLLRPRCRLQRVLESRDRKPAMIARESAKEMECIVGYPVLCCTDVPHDERPVILCGILEGSKLGPLRAAFMGLVHDRRLGLDVQPDGVGIGPETETRRAHHHLVAATNHASIASRSQTCTDGHFDICIAFGNHGMDSPQQT